MHKLNKLINTNIGGSEELITPEEMRRLIPASEKALHHVLKSRQTICEILDGKDKRLLIVVGPCSIHDTKAAKEYAEKLHTLKNKLADELFIVMRVYFEKPRSTTGWKGLINDPYLDDSFHIEEGLKIARKLLVELNEMGLPCATEALDPITPQYLAEFISWAAIGARTTESQTHREMASGLSMPVGIKNGTDGSIQVAVNALKSVKTPHHFLGINQDGKISKFSTRGNLYAHIVLRGGEGNPNYDAANIKKCEEVLVTNGLRTQIIVDCSHANSNKDYKKQEMVLKDCLTQISKGNKSIVGFMIESNLDEGSQKIPEDLSQLKYGVSITDPCVGWDTTEKMLVQIQKTLKTITRK
ncbi:MAG: 3-deoxy-7-phosphoheptulonate synthase [Deltaproteobacteria bacterium RIFCSPLOWO2_12_FULL_40_28]|nr:MAG: 3-deoxy-7-phosphoheptulonate synthase [Deltaproteobacteria bacterium RIFCSPHIGHO2_02_FULL_40_28]OGQ20364.1 MAG: 3-deoxy-7-phosphoheptulonate synthase [Deltaproteobacteria bacterium RIFCSPHIGHO2_12_FULL_40_32]OGQ41333.1 MAG: 3-deoxy-7-phosphoheptulonate synthase [Deltaproteobacteria bacterium RIFCSPLOWO2_02_FULL_40_36]OGQ54972.1 MAG: 3-deoxy-7-phosphoheptulonate synthase [Deltaproteobacteria bacterium RIFCSPLOWO2_12_FULL_40_28]